MNWDTIEGKWDQFKGAVREQWGKLTDDDIEQIGGKKDKLKGKLQEKYGYAKDRAEEEVNSFCGSCDSSYQNRTEDEYRRQNTTI